MRVWLRPDRMAQLGITVQEVSAAIQSQNQTFGIGQIGAPPARSDVEQQFVVTAQGLLTKPEEFENIIVRTAKEGAAIVRIKRHRPRRVEQARLFDPSRMNGKTATTIGIYQQPGANAVETAKARAQADGGAEGAVPHRSRLQDRARHEPVHPVLDRQGRAHLLRGGGPGRDRGVRVPAVAARATIIPILAVPVSIIGTFIGMHMLGFSINMLTMFGMILAIGLVVDDAIVVVENVEVNITKGLPRWKHRSRR